MKLAEIQERYPDLQCYVGWTAEDEQWIALAATYIRPHIPEMVADFYATILEHSQAARVITGGREQVERLKGTLALWIDQLLTGPYDEAYVARRARVGQKHVEIGLEQIYTNVALSRMRGWMTGIVLREWKGTSPERGQAIASLNRLLDLDLAVITAVYQGERSDREKAILQTRLETIGQVAAGLAHEARNALQRIQASAEMLELEVQDRPEALAFVRRIEQAQAHMHRLFDEVRGYAAPIKLDRANCRLSYLWREAWEILASQRADRDARLVEPASGCDVELNVDHFRLVQVFRNILENALAACSDAVRIEIICAPVQLCDRPAVQIAVRDNGPGIDVEPKQKIFEPFFTTKPKGTGLGMAIAQRLIEAHGGTIEVGPHRPGAEILVTLPLLVPA